MSLTTRYLQIDSTYRNRTQYPNQCNFVVPISVSGQKSDPIQALDPIANAVPVPNGFTANPQTPSPVFPGIPNQISNSPASSTFLIYINIGNVNPATQFTDFWINSVLEINSDTPSAEYSIIQSYSPTGGTQAVITVDPPYNNLPQTGSFVNFRYAQPITIGTVGPTGNTFNTVNLGTIPSPVNIYTGNFIRFRGTFLGSSNYGQTSQIISYNPSTSIITTKTPFSYIPIDGDQYEIDAFTRDNFSPLIFPGTMTMNQPVSYEVKLLWLILPQFTQPVGNTSRAFSNAIGGSWDRYPYIYIHLYNESNNHNNYRVLYSNNPNANRATFQVPVLYYSGNPEFIVLKDCEQAQTIKFKPDESMRFTITLPDGEIPEFEFIAAQTTVGPVPLDRISPNVPNPLVQVNAGFSMKRIA